MKKQDMKKSRRKAADNTGDMSTLWGEKAARRRSFGAGGGHWFSESKFAMFIHWGLFSEAAGCWRKRTYFGISEWLMYTAQIPVKEYKKLARRFNPVEFRAGEWVRLAKAAGMKYIVITAKHHEGFAMFKSAVSSYNIVDATPFRRDPLKELADACQKEGLKLGFYYSQFQDWHDRDADGNTWDFPVQGDFDKYLRQKAMPQIEELLTNYGPVALIWFDTPGSISREASQELVDKVHRLQPDCLVNSRIGNGLGDYVTLGDQEIPLTAPEGLWETIDTHNDTWAYAAADHNWKGPHELISRLIRSVSLGGNYMLNIGPTGKGVIPEESAAILRQVGEWVHRNSEAIYGTRKSPIGRQAWGCCTAGPGSLYLHVLDWPKNGELWVPGFKATVTSACFLTSGNRLKFTRERGHLRITVPLVPPDQLVTVIKLTVSGTMSVTADTLFLHDGLVNEFNAPFAAFRGCRHGKRQWMEKFGDWHHMDVVEDWKRGSSARWKFTALKPGMFTLYADYDCLPEADGSEFEIAVGETRWAFPALCTGKAENRIRARHERLGIIFIPKAGPYTLAIRALDVKAKNAFILEKLTLTP
jgi:alpha-L-fucosidase